MVAQRSMTVKPLPVVRFRDEGWSFVTFEEALQDEMYRLKYDYVGVQGAGHLDATRPPIFD